MSKRHKHSRGILPVAMGLALLFSGHAVADARNAELHQQYDEAWNAFMDGLQNARKTLIEQQQFAPPNQNDRISAEGYRYLLAHLERMIDMNFRMDPKFPEFHASMNMLRKWTIENPDTMYLKAPIDASGYYKVTGRTANHQEWKTSERGLAGPKAPRMVTFQTITNVPGDTGGLQEMADCTNATLDFQNSFSLQVEDDGRFELLIGAEKPKDFDGNFLLSRKEMTCAATSVKSIREANYLAVREIFSDWENEQAIDMEIQRLDSIGAERPAITPEDVTEALNKMAKHMPNQIRFWNMLHEIPLEVYSDKNQDGRRNMPLNGINQPALPFTAGGVAGSKQLYAAGSFQIADDEALLVVVNAPAEPHYISFQLGTPWGEGPDQQNYVSSLTGHQNPVSSDGKRYYIVSATDPGVQGWVDTTGARQGTHSMRFVFRDQPDVANMPKAKASIVKLSELATRLPADHPKVSAQQRRLEVAIRQSHIKQRWRGH